MMAVLIAHLNGVAQTDFVTKQFETTIESDIVYGEALDFAGTTRTLLMDIAFPTNDNPGPCGRPLVMIIHGGAWLGGSKEGGYVGQLLTDFAERGYVAASITYRLGMFQTEKNINCNISQTGNLLWNCLNMSDTLEWTRAWYRAVQDGKGALRFLISQDETYQIDRRNVFVVGESAGAFNALGVVYLDDNSEKPASCGEVDPVLPPNAIYESQCITDFGYASSISAMDLSRPDLGPISGTLHPEVDSFVIKACGDIYGGLFIDLVSVSHYEVEPDLYLYHQPADLIVPINYQRVLQGLSNCANGLAGCQSIYGRPFTYGSNAVVALLDSLEGDGHNTPAYLYDKTTNNASCLEQVLNPSTSGHALDNFNLRTTNMASFFADRIDLSADCLISATQPPVSTRQDLRVYPNPVGDRLNISPGQGLAIYRVFDNLGRRVLEIKGSDEDALPVGHLKPGIYTLCVQHLHKNQWVRFIKQ